MSEIVCSLESVKETIFGNVFRFGLLGEPLITKKSSCEYTHCVSWLGIPIHYNIPSFHTFVNSNVVLKL